MRELWKFLVVCLSSFLDEASGRALWSVGMEHIESTGHPDLLLGGWAVGRSLVGVGSGDGEKGA